MGINGLLPVLKPICEAQHVKAFSQQRVGVDASSWLHKGAFACALELATGTPTRRYVDYCMHRVRMLIHFGAIPVLVFDGAPLPVKAATNDKRRELRGIAKEAGNAALRRGDTKAAADQFQRGIEVTHEMARALIREIRKLNVEYFVAPYEADAQLAWLSLNGYVDVVITEDSDLVVYGARKIFYKMSKTGDGELYQTKNLLGLDDPDMRHFTPDMFMWVCVFSGCDFFPGVTGLGIRKAHALVRRSRTLQRVLQVVRYDTRYSVKSDFADHFVKACMAFRHQTVFNPITKSSQHLTPFDETARAGVPDHVLAPSPGAEEDLTFLGAIRDDAVARGIADGTIHPMTLVVYQEPLDFVERSVSQGPSASEREARGRSSASRVSGLAVNKAGSRGRKGITGRPLFHAHGAPVSSSLRRPLFFASKSAVVTDASPAVYGPFKPPQRTSLLPDANNPLPGEEPPRNREWMKRSLSTLNPGGVPLHHLKRAVSKPGSTPTSAKRQRTLLDFGKRQSVAMAASRFADTKQRSRTIPSNGVGSSVGGSNDTVSEPPGTENSEIDDTAKTPDATQTFSQCSPPASPCPPSPDSDAYDMFEAVEKEEESEGNPCGDTQSDPGRAETTEASDSELPSVAQRQKDTVDRSAGEAEGTLSPASTGQRSALSGPVRFVSPYFPDKRLSLKTPDKPRASLPTKALLASLMSNPRQ